MLECFVNDGKGRKGILALFYSGCNGQIRPLFTVDKDIFFRDKWIKHVQPFRNYENAQYITNDSNESQSTTRPSHRLQLARVRDFIELENAIELLP